MHEFRKYVILIVCIASCAVAVLMGVMQMIEDRRVEAEFGEVRWDTPKVSYYRGGSVRRAPSSQGSSVVMPRVSSSSQTLFHHNTGGSYSGQSATTYSSGNVQTGYRSSYASSSAQPVRTFSNGAIHSYGGGGSGGGMTGVSSHRKASNNAGTVGYTTPSYSLSVPHARSYAYNSVQGTSSETPARMSMPGRRKTAPDRDGEEGEVVQVGDEWWYWDEGWVGLKIGDTRTIGDDVFRWDGSNWVTNENFEEQFTPIGDIPWLLLLLLIGGYAVLRVRQSARTDCALRNKSDRCLRSPHHNFTSCVGDPKKLWIVPVDKTDSKRR